MLASESLPLSEIFADKPITFLKLYAPHILWPRVLRRIFVDIWTGKSGPLVIVKGPRGGGKSRFLGSLGFCQWFFKKRSIVDMGGAFGQAKVVYEYFTSIIFADKMIMDSVEKEPMMEMTKGKDGQYFKCVAGSMKQVRGPHPDDLMADEVCEAKDEVVEAALPMVDTSPSPLIILTSTFHKIYGIFQDIWDRADELGYRRYSWDVFDVAKAFDRAIFDDPELNRQIPDLQKLKELSSGRSGDPQGWIPIANIIKAWRGKRSIDWFLVEYMGQRPSASGLINDPVDVDNAAFDSSTNAQYSYVEGAECVLGIDWGFSSMTSVVDLMAQKDGVLVEIENKNYQQTSSEIIIDDVVDIVKERGHRFIYADSAGKFENDALQKALNKAIDKYGKRVSCKVIEVVFRQDKEEMLGNYRAYFRRGMIKIPDTHHTALWQHKRYRYVEGSDKPQKKDDHIPDATMCAMKHWPLGEEASSIDDIKQVKDSRPITAGLRDKRF